MSAVAPPRAQSPQAHARILARRRAVAAAGERRRRRVFASLVALLVLAVGGVALSSSPLFAVDEVRVTGVAGEQAELVRDVAGVEPGEPLLAVDLGLIGDEVAAVPWVRDVAVSRIPPSTIEVAVTPREPVVNVGLANAWWLLDAEGYVVGGGLREDLVRIEALSSALPGPGQEAADAAVRNALAVHLALPAQVRAQVDRYDAPSDRGLRLHLAEAGVWVRVGLAERVELKAEVMLLLLERARAGAEPGEPDEQDLGELELDVRAPDNPVLIPGGGAASSVDL